MQREEELRGMSLRSGAETEAFRSARSLLHASALGSEDSESYSRRVHEFCEELLDRHQVVFAGGLRSDKDHSEIFQALYELVLVARAT